jgi:hypothetical protein
LNQGQRGLKIRGFLMKLAIDSLSAALDQLGLASARRASQKGFAEGLRGVRADY